MANFNLPATIQTVRIPELANYLAYGPLTTSDYMMMWLASANKTVKVGFDDLYDFFQGVGGGSFTPVVMGDKIVHVVTAAEDGGDTVLMPAIAGQNFYLERDGQPLLASEYEILNAGGFKIVISGQNLIEGQRFLITLYALQSAPLAAASSGGSFIQGTVNISTNTTFDNINHVRKLLRLREDPATHAKLVLTLPLIENIPENTIIPIEATIGNTVEHKVESQGSQLIYMNSTSFSSLYIRPGETLWLFRGTDGFYVINDFYKIYTELGTIKSSYKASLNELVCKGQILNRLDYPRLWAWVQTLGTILVSDAVWGTASAVTSNGQTTLLPYRGCFSTGDGSTTFRLPDLMNMFLRGVKSESGIDGERVLNKPGGYQKPSVESHDHTLPTESGGSTDRQSLTTTANADEGLSSSNKTGSYGEAETRPENVAVLWTIKV